MNLYTYINKIYKKAKTGSVKWNRICWQQSRLYKQLHFYNYSKDNIYSIMTDRTTIDINKRFLTYEVIIKLTTNCLPFPDEVLRCKLIITPFKVKIDCLPTEDYIEQLSDISYETILEVLSCLKLISDKINKQVECDKANKQKIQKELDKICDKLLEI